MLVKPVRLILNKANNQNLLKLMKLTGEMLELADLGDRDRDDTGCGILFGILRDTGYKLRKLVEEECLNHKKAGKW